jgi:hypothetical protein
MLIRPVAVLDLIACDDSLPRLVLCRLHGSQARSFGFAPSLSTAYLLRRHPVGGCGER